MNEQLTPPLDTNLAAVDTSFQLVAAGIYDLQVMKSEVKATKKGGRMIHLELATVDPAPSHLDPAKTLSPGVRLFHNQNITPSGKATWQTLIEGPSGIAALVQTAGIAEQVTMANLETLGVPMLQGRRVRAAVKFAPAGTTSDGKSYREKNEIAYWITKK